MQKESTASGTYWQIAYKIYLSTDYFLQLAFHSALQLPCSSRGSEVRPAHLPRKLRILLLIFISMSSWSDPKNQ